MKSWSALAFAMLLLPSLAQARVFDFKSASFAPYIRGTYGFSNMNTSAFGASCGPNVNTDKTANSAAGGEFGFVLNFTSFSVRIGAEYLIPKTLTSVTGTQNGVKMFSLESKASAFIPQLNLELSSGVGPESRFFYGGGVGYAMATIDNTYTMTSQGTTNLGPTDFKESGSGTGIGGQVFAGYETLFTDTVTISFDLGYRYYNSIPLTATADATAITGTETKGQALKNDDGTNRTISLSGLYSGLTLRFYF